MPDKILTSVEYDTLMMLAKVVDVNRLSPAKSMVVDLSGNVNFNHPIHILGDITLSGRVDDVDIAALKVTTDTAIVDLEGFPDALKDLTVAEITQLQAIDAATISAVQWGYLGATDQGVATTDNITVASLSVTNNISVGGTVNGVDIAALEAVSGEFNVTLACGTSGSITLNTNYDKLQYRKEGSHVFISGYIEVASVSSPLGDVTLEGLPFDLQAGGEAADVTLFNIVLRDLNVAPAGSIIAFADQFSANKIYIRDNSNTTGSLNSDFANHFKATTGIFISGTYLTAE